MVSIHKRIAAIAAALSVTAASAGCAPDEPSGEVITITCATCQESPTDPFLQYNFEAAQRFNTAHAGEYVVETIENQNAGSSPDRLQYYKRLALADDLPDLFQLNSAEIQALQDTAKLRDFGDDLSAAPEWEETFKPDVFTALGGPDGQIWAIPQQRDAIGIYWNKALFKSVGYETFPGTWAEFEQAAAKLKQQGKVALAADGDWATMLMWVNLIGTQPGGKEFLEEGVTQPGYEKNAEVVQATERLRTWHEEGWVNSDAFSGDFQDAATAYLSGSAATVANGPWFVKTNLKTDAAPTDLYGQTGYTLSPGWSEGERGVVTVTGAGWASGTDPHDDKDSEAVIAFLQFVSSAEETIRQAEATGANPPVNVDPEEFKAADVEPLSVQIVEQAEEATYSYPHVRVHGPAGFGDAWKNLWPAYVKGELDTREFLSRLGTDAAGRG